MRTNEKHGVLACGGHGARVYVRPDCWVIVKKSNFLEFPAGTVEAFALSAYATLRYQPAELRDYIVEDFKYLVEAL